MTLLVLWCWKDRHLKKEVKCQDLSPALSCITALFKDVTVQEMVNKDDIFFRN